MSDIERHKKERDERRIRRRDLAVGVDTGQLIREAEAQIDELIAMVEGYEDELLVAKSSIASFVRAVDRMAEQLADADHRTDQARADVRKLREVLSLAWTPSQEHFMPSERIRVMVTRDDALAETDREEYR